MNLHLPLPLLAWCLALPALADSSATELGNVMYIGDSITHGINSASYRWELHKIFVDDGIGYNAVGIESGNFSGGVASGTPYGNIAFTNLHSSEASARAYEIAGRQDGARYGRFNYANIENWLGLSNEKNNGATYTGQTFTAEKGNQPDTFFLLIGTNDLLSDIPSDQIATQLPTIQPKLLGDIGTIADSIRQADSQAQLIVLTIPTWTTHANNNSAAAHQAVESYNRALESWAEGQTNVRVIDINPGLVDVSSSTPFFGNTSMFNKPGTVSGSDGLHPNAQGDLLIAGNIAKAMGYAGRSAGQERRAAEDFAVDALRDQADFTTSGNASIDGSGIELAAGGSLHYDWADTDLQGSGFSLDLGLRFGDGATNGWSTADSLSVTLGTDDFYGTLSIRESSICWGDNVLYSTDMSQNNGSIRLAWVAGHQSEQLSSGYYVWLGDQLIGDALGVTYGSGKGGLTLSSTGNAQLTHLALDGSGAYAPTSTGIVNEALAFVATGWDSPPTKGAPQGNQSWEGATFTAERTGLSATGTYNARAQVDNTAGQAGNSIHADITGGSATYIYGNSGNYTGDVLTTITNAGGASSWFGAHGNGGTLTGSTALRLTDNAAGGATVFGAVNATKVTGDVYVELSADNARYKSFTSTNGGASLVGSYATEIGGNIDLVVNSGTLDKGIMGGLFTGNKTIGGKASVYVNGGTIGGDVSGGGLTGTINGGTAVTVTFGSINGDVYGGGRGDTINTPADAGDAPASSLTLSGGTITGNAYGGSKGGTINGSTAVTIEGSALVLHDGTAWGDINGGSNGGRVTGDTTITLKDVLEVQGEHSFDKYAGTISGGNAAGQKSLVLDNVQVRDFQAQLRGLNRIELTNGTQTTLHGLGGANALELGDNCSLTLDGLAELSRLRMGENSSLTLQGLGTQALLIDISGAENYAITLTNLADDVSHIIFTDGKGRYAAQLADVDTQANSARLVADIPHHPHPQDDFVIIPTAIPEPATTTLSLLALAGLVMRRRRC